MRTNLLVGALAASLAVALAPLPLAAHNGALALAEPVEGIAIDGDLSDWPGDLTRHPIMHFPGAEADRFGLVPPLGAEDYQGQFRLGYSTRENALFLAVEVADESVIIDGGSGWNTQDGCMVVIDLSHAGLDSVPPAHHRLFGDWRHPGSYEVAAQRDSFGHRYEFRIDIGPLSANRLNLDAGTVVGRGRYRKRTGTRTARFRGLPGDRDPSSIRFRTTSGGMWS